MGGEILTGSKGTPSRSQRREVTGERIGNQRAIAAGSDDESESYIQRKPIKIIAESMISSIALLADGQQFVSGDKNGKTRRWRVEDGEEVGVPIDAESAVRCVATSQDGKWIVTRTEAGRVSVWDAESRGEKIKQFKRKKGANSVDISSDGTVKSQLHGMTTSSTSTHSRTAIDCAAGRTATFTRSSFHLMGSSLPVVVSMKNHPFFASTTLSWMATA